MGEKNAVLTTGQREFLRGDTDIDADSNHGRMVRSRIRDRIRTALTDFDLVYRELPEKDRTQIFGDGSLEETDAELHEGIISLMAFLYERLNETDRTGEFEELIEAGVWRSLDNPRMVKYTPHVAKRSPHPVETNIDSRYVVDLGRVGEKINTEGWGALDESDLEAVETLLNRKRGEVIAADFREHLQANVDRIREIREGQETARQKMLDEINDLDTDAEE